MRVVVQVSGGIESTVLLAKTIQEYGRENVFPITFDADDASWRNREYSSVKTVVTELQVNDKLFCCRVPQSDRLELPKSTGSSCCGLIPGLKLFYDAGALAWAQKLGASKVYTGNMQANVFPDESAAFETDLTNLWNTYYAPGIQLVSPFAGKTKAWVIQEAQRIGVLDLLYSTVTCGDERLAGSYNCGVCSWCLARREAFRIAGVPDKTRYLFHEDDI